MGCVCDIEAETPAVTQEMLRIRERQLELAPLSENQLFIDRMERTRQSMSGVERASQRDIENDGHP